MYLFTHSALLRALGWSLFNSLWQMGLCWMLYRLSIAVLRNASAHVRHNLAILLLGVGAIGSLLQFVSGYFFAGTSTGSLAGNAIGLGSFAGIRALTGSGQVFINEVLSCCSSLYLVVLGVLLFRYSNHYFHSRRLRYTGLSKMQPELRVFTETICYRMGIRQPVQAWLSSLVDVPLTLGFIRPVILLPVAMVNNLTLQQTEAILLHELAHIRRNDYLLNLGVTTLELLFFFNPFTRLLIREIRREREHRCDDWVLQFRYDPHTYVSALLSLAAHSPQRPLLTLAATGNGNDRLLLQRARRILQQKDAPKHSGNSYRPTAKAVVLLLFTLAMTLAGERFQKPLSTREEALRISSLPAGTTHTAATSFPINLSRSFTAHTIVDANTTHSTTSIRFTEFTEVWAAQRPPARVRITGTPRKPRPVITSHPTDLDQFTEEGEELNNVVLVGGDATAPPTETYAAVSQPDYREYSIGNGPSITLVPAPESQKMKNENLPFVPNSSFSVQYMEDSTRPVEQLAYWQLSAQKEIATALNKLQQDLAVQLRALEQKQAAETRSDPTTLLQLRKQELKLQQQYFLKLDTLRKKMEKANKRLRIVYI